MWISPYNANYSSPILVINNTIVGNSDGAPHETSGIYTTGFAQNVTFTNNIVVAVPGQNAITCDNSYSSVSPVFSHNDAYSFRGAGFTGWCIASPNSGNFSSDPIFLNSDNNDFHLSQSSPAIDAGDNAAPNLPSADFDGNPRVADGNGDGVAVIDLGAYEVVNTSAANLSPISLSFNPQGVGTTSPAQPVLLSSSGSTSFQITSIQISSGFTQTSNCPVLTAVGNTTGVAGGSSCIFSVGFDPTYAVSLSGSLTVNGTKWRCPDHPAERNRYDRPSRLAFYGQLGFSRTSRGNGERVRNGYAHELGSRYSDHIFDCCQRAILAIQQLWIRAHHRFELPDQRHI